MPVTLGASKENNQPANAMRNTQLKPEHAIALRWLRHCEKTGTTEKISDPHTFALHISEAEEEGELRLNHREIDHAETIRIAALRLKAGMFPKTIANFTK